METNNDINQKRIALLIAAGEDVRNTPAWQDAAYERWMISELAYQADVGTSFVAAEWE